MFNKLKILKKMKIKNLIAVAALLMGSTNAFAEPTYVKTGGIAYEVLTDMSGTTPGTVYVYGILSNANGNAIKTAKAVSIPKSITLTVDDESKTYNVVAIGDGWETKTGEGYQDLSGVIETLSIDVTNFVSPGLESTDFDGFTKLASLTITDTYTPTTAKPAQTVTLPAIPATVATLDFENTNITSMGTATFTGTTLTSVKLSKKLTEIPSNAFKNCTKLAGTITIPATVVTIKDYAFAGDALADFDFSGATALKEIYAHAFDGSGITKLALGNCAALEKIWGYAFNGCEKLANLVLGGLKDGKKFVLIGKYAFQGSAIAAANLPASVTSVDEGAFKGCKKLTAVSAMAGLTAIPNYMFTGCEALTKVTISKDVATIGTSAFEGCKALATVTFAERGDADPDLTTIGANAFKGCEALTSLDLSSKKFTFDQIMQWFNGCKALSEIKLSENVKGIWGSSFKDAVLEDLDLSNTKLSQLDFIFGTGRTAATAYSSLKSIKLPETCTKFAALAKDGVFAYCTSLEEITIPNAFVAANAVPAYAFYYCTSLKTVTYSPVIEATAKVFNENAFLGCTPFVLIATNTYYTSFTGNDVAPKNATFGSAASDVVKTVKDNGTSGKYFGKLCPLNDVTIDVNDAKVYSIYVDGGTAYFQSLLQRSGKYIVKKNEHVIVKTDEAKEVKLTPYKGPGTQYSVTVDEMFSLKEAVPTSEVQGGTVAGTKVIAKNEGIYACGSGKYIYRLTNNASTGGFGFTFFSGTTMKDGQFFIISSQKPAGAARLNVVWLDENGNVEEGATAIQSIDKADAEDGAIYNLQGIRVNNAKKGLYIKNGKKYIMK